MSTRGEDTSTYVNGTLYTAVLILKESGFKIRFTDDTVYGEKKLSIFDNTTYSCCITRVAKLELQILCHTEYKASKIDTHRQNIEMQKQLAAEIEKREPHFNY